MNDRQLSALADTIQASFCSSLLNPQIRNKLDKGNNDAYSCGDAMYGSERTLNRSSQPGSG